MAGADCRAGGVQGQLEPGLRIPPAVEGYEALAEQGEPFRRSIATFLGGMKGLAEVGDRGVMVTPLRGIPDKLAHERRRLGLGRVQLAAHIAPPRVRAEEGNLAEVLRCVSDQRG